MNCGRPRLQGAEYQLSANLVSTFPIAHTSERLAGIITVKLKMSSAIDQGALSDPMFLASEFREILLRIVPALRFTQITVLTSNQNHFRPDIYRHK